MTENTFTHHYGHCLGDTSVEEFLAQYWQQKPLLIRNAFPGIESPLSADELAGLACEESVNARLVLEKAANNKKPWRVEFGPFEPSRFSSLPESHWTLLVSDVEKHVPESTHLLEPFRFIPDWRIDDLMISYAPAGGSVGPHTDAYDVFLIQLSGQRRWQISEKFANDTLEDTDLCILKEFTGEQDWLLNAGDMLYLPPNIAHLGVAQAADAPCLTASVGFRAPSLKTICNEYVHFLSENSLDESRYHDIDPRVPTHHAEISDLTVDHFIDYLKHGLTLDHEQVKRWLGEYCSDNKAFEALEETQQNLSFTELSALASQSELQQSPYSHFLFSHSAPGALLFVDGLSYKVSAGFAGRLCENKSIDFSSLLSVMTAEDQHVLLTLFNNGAIIENSDE